MEHGGEFRAVKMDGGVIVKKEKDVKSLDEKISFRKIFKMPTDENENYLQLKLHQSGATNRLNAKTWISFFDAARKLPELKNINDSIPRAHRKVEVPNVLNLPSVDFADSRNRFYQATISLNKRVSDTHRE
jgi:hypothetical protein